MQATAARRLDRLPHSAFHSRLARMIGLGLFFDAFDLYMAAGVMVALAATGFATPAQNAQFVSAGALGSLVGALLAGWMGDRFGRRVSFQVNLAIFGTMSLAAALVPAMPWLIAARFVMGLGLGAEVVVGYAMLAEFVPPARRGRWGATLSFVATSALLVSNVVAMLVIPRAGWRWMFAIAGAGGLAVWILRKRMPESPRWLESMGRHAQAEATLREIEEEVAASTGQALPAAALDACAPGPATNRAGLVDLFKPPLLRSTLVGMTINIVSMSVLYGFVIWMPTFLVRQGLSIASSMGHAAVMAVGSILGVFLAGLVTDRVSRRRTLVATSLAAALCGIAYPYGGDIATTTTLGFVLTTVLFFGGAIGFSTYVPEIFPTELRLRGTAVSSVAGRAASVFAPPAMALLFAADGVRGITLALVSLLVAQAAIVLALGVETHARTLERAAPVAGLGTDSLSESLRHVA